MSRHLTESVIADGQVFEAGTLASAAGADVIPDGPWWSEPAQAEAEAPGNEGEQEGDETVPEGSPSEEWTVKQLRAFAKAQSIDLGGVTAKADIITALTK